MQPASMHRRCALLRLVNSRMPKILCRLQKRMAVGGNMFVYDIWHGG
jgi:hypothetical protein